MTFKKAKNGLYETSIPCPTSAQTAAATTTCACKGNSLAHPTVLLHHRLGHIGQGYLRTLITSKSIQGLPHTYTPVPAPLHTSCLPCIESKTQAQPHPPQRTRAQGVLNKVHCDLVGPYPVAGLKGEQYRLTIVDDHSRFGWVFPLHTKDQAKYVLINWIALVENQTGKHLKHFHADRGGEFLNKTLLQHLTNKGVTYSFSNPHSPQQNGVAEARNKATGRILLALLLQSEAPHSLWTHAVQHANFINNLFPHHLLDKKTPFEAWHGKQPSMDRLRVWGCTGHVLLNKDERRKSGGKLGPVTKPCVLLGINHVGAGWLLLDTSTNREVHSSDVVFQEDIPFYKSRTDRADEAPLTWLDFTDPEHIGPELPSPDLPEEQQEAAPPVIDIPAIPDDPNMGHAEDNAPDAPDKPANEGMLRPPQPEREIQAPAPPQEHPQRQSLRLQGVRAPSLPPLNLRWYPDERAGCAIQLPQPVHALVQTIALGESEDKRREIPTPGTHKEALNGPHAAEWMESMIKEYNGLKSTGTFELVPRSDARNVVKCKWVYKVKRSPEGTPFFKSRLVAKGFSQKEGIDYFATWAPTARHTTARVFLHLAASRDMEIDAMDVDQAFLQGELHEEIYMDPPPALPDSPAPDMVWRLRKPLYGLKQSPRQWHAKLKIALLQLGFQPSHGDPSLYVGITSQGIWMLVYVDDMLLASEDPAELAALKHALKNLFPMKDLGSVKTYLGMDVTRDRDKRELYLSQERYIHDLLHRFQFTDCKAADTPLAVNHGLNLPKPDEEPIPGQERYAELLGGIMYTMVSTRPDIAHAVSVLSRFIADGRHGATHWKAALRLLSYLKGTAKYKLVLGGTSTDLVGFSDSSWADDQVDRRSSQGYCFTLGSGVVSWKATRSPSVALSSCKAELYAGTTAAQDVVWLHIVTHPLLGGVLRCIEVSLQLSVTISGFDDLVLRRIPEPKSGFGLVLFFHQN